jgi:long-chain acyl-CoA synthetase
VGINATGGLKKKLFDAAVAAKTHNLVTTGELKHGFYDALIFNKIKKALGFDHIRLVVSGSAPLSTTVMLFYRILLGVPVIEGYGQTEGAACATICDPEDMMTAGHVGGPNPACEIVLADVPEMGYLHTDTDHKGQPCQGRGEIWVRGPVVFKGYYKDPEKTKETVDEEGWLHSGDIGLWTSQGQLQIVDRKKNIFKLSQGEYVAPEKIENVIIQSLLVAQAFVYGDSLQSALIAIIVPDEEPLRSLLASHQSLAAFAKASLNDICQNKEINKILMAEISKVAKKNSLHGFEIPRAVHLDAEPFSIENGLLTPTFKLKRQQARDKYEKQIEGMYAVMSKPRSKI